MNITTDTTYLENQIVEPQFLCSLTFLTNIHLNKLNLQLQGKKQTISQMIGVFGWI